MVEPQLHRVTLPNGLRVVLAPDSGRGSSSPGGPPVVGVSVHYDVGFRSEPQGRTGFAHLFEHLMFQGSESLEKLAHFRHVQGSGGIFNGSTHQDYTDYFQVLPSNALERALFLEADRMRAPKITEENLRNQVDVVKEEIRLNVLNRPYGGFPWILLPPVLYSTFANAHNGYGDFTDLEQATVEDCAAFFDTYYAPGNAVLTIAGDIDVDQATDLVHKHFGDVPARPVAQRPSFSEPYPAQELRDRHADPHAPLPAIALGYRLPDPVAELDSYLANVVLAAVLSDGDASRLQQRMVHRESMVVDVHAGAGLMGAPLDARDPDTFTLTAIRTPEVDSARVVGAIDEELERIAADGPTAEELARVTARWSAGLYREHDRLMSRTLDLGSAELVHGRAELISELPSRVGEITAQDVAAAAKALRPDARAVLEIEPASEESSDGGAA
ncbi:putative Zn-dependent peptidase [Halopolyspora algeriensis]|uniref:Putative Zn-dependent peptidase n=1 Tax=Halopolyspora algeriensis TaxID=1500506 RepID=A0A368VMT2_9ACTN|nr:pitrilysin family protein [Halopolyspora algeriensis]RCW42838.1 putative Zn-dependent peptidase [Halopolyspora algeriensis]TQM56692.1 putative Zn-dependent peptidase [Halopolyspora algeriensis]